MFTMAIKWEIREFTSWSYSEGKKRNTLSCALTKSVADPDFQIVGGGGACHPDPEIRLGPGLKKNFFGPSGLIFV